MKVIFGILIVVIVAVSVVFYMRPAEKGPEDFIYMYYPKVNVYYHVANNEYLAFDSSEKKWTSRKELDSGYKASLGKNIVLNITDEPIWKNNDQHRLIYGTSLYTSSSDVKEKFIEDSIQSLPPKKPVVVKNSSDTVEEEKKRSGFRRFMDRIFKKKPKKD